MKLKRIMLVLSIILIFMGCFMRMNKNFDSLSRYPYESEKDRQLIKKYLNTNEIEYIIEYSIAPVEFIRYIDKPGFNIYHTDKYKYISDVFWYLDDTNVVSFTEDLIRLDKIDEAVNLSLEYYYNEIIFFLKNCDVYNKSAVLIDNPNSIYAYLDENHTVSIRNPYPLVRVDFIDTNDADIYIRDVVYEPLKKMYETMISDLSKRYTDNLYISNGYISYDMLVELYDNDKSWDMPGHSDHQLGLAFDLALKSGDYETSKQFAWIKENAYKYGFIVNKNEGDMEKDSIFHLRYVGYDLALRAYENNLTLKEVLNK